MTAKLYAMTCGRLVGRLKDMIEGEDGPVALPIPSYLIEHPKGRALFDTGMHPQAAPTRRDGWASGSHASSASSSTARTMT